MVYFWLCHAGMVFGANTLDYRTDQILIQPKPGIDGFALAAFHAAHGSKVSRTCTTGGGVQVITLPAGETVPGLIAQYQQSGLVEFAEPDYLVHADATLPNDPKFLDGTLWALNNYGQNGGTAHADMDAPDAWDVLTSASNIVVAVLDTGIRLTHEDLAANLWINPADGTHGYNALTGTNNPNDDSGHGSLVAGVLGAVGNNGKGVTGLAWQVQMMACKCLDSSGNGSDSSVVACLEFALTNGAKIINASFDSGTPSLAVSNAIVAAQQAGVIWVASAGNNALNVDVTPHYPACYSMDNIVSVAYTTRNDALGGLSNYGATNVDLAAPGDQIYSTFASSDTAYYPPPILNINIAGTSFSAGYVSGALALMLAKYPAENYQQIIRRLYNATDPLPALAGKCATGGRLNLKKALNPPIWLAPVNPVNPGTFQLHLSTGPNRQCVLQMSSDLKSWTAISTNNTSSNGTLDFTNIPSLPQRFYRATAAL
jgi:subtilisin family serine protease